MIHAFLISLLVVCVAVVSGCGGAPVAVVEAVDVTLAALPRESPMREDEWRRAWRFSAGAPQRITLPVPAGADLLRLGVLPRGVLNAPVKAVVLLDDREIYRFDAADPMAWTDQRIDLAAAGTDRVCTVVLESTRDFWVGPCEVASTAASAPNVLIVLIDTLRQDHLACYGYPRATSPAIDALAADGIRFDTLVPQSSWTRPSVASLLTSCYPGTHGAIDRDTLMRPQMPTLAAQLRGAGYETHALMMNPNCLPSWNIGTEFDRLIDLVGPDPNLVDDARGVDAALETIAARAGRPWFLYLHLMGPHDPYVPPPPYDTMFQGGATYPPETQALVNQYDGEIAYTNAQILRLLDALKARDLYDDTFIVLLSDHGEQFGEHGEVGHGHSLHAEELRVPFVVKLPGQAQAGTAADALVEMVDVAPTLLAHLGIPADPRFEGRSFAGLLQGEATAPRKGYSALNLGQKSMDMARDAGMKFIRDHSENTRVYYDLLQDPKERYPLSDAQAQRGDLNAHAARIAAKGAVGLNVLVTAGDDNPARVELILRGADLGTATVDYYADCAGVEQRESMLRVSLDFIGCHDRMIGSEAWFGGVQQDSARITLSTPPGAAFTVEVHRDGQRVHDVVFAGESREPVAADTPLRGDAIPGSPRDFDPVNLPRGLAAYLWYTETPEQIADEALDPEMLQQLEALGYVR